MIIQYNILLIYDEDHTTICLTRTLLIQTKNGLKPSKLKALQSYSSWIVAYTDSTWFHFLREREMEPFHRCNLTTITTGEMSGLLLFSTAKSDLAIKCVWTNDCNAARASVRLWPLMPCLWSNLPFFLWVSIGAAPCSGISSSKGRGLNCCSIHPLVNNLYQQSKRLEPQLYYRTLSSNQPTTSKPLCTVHPPHQPQPLLGIFF